MLDTDISTAEAIRHLSRPDQPAIGGAHALDRRRFLQLIGAGLAAGAVGGPGMSMLDSILADGSDTSWAAGPVGPNDGILVVIGMYGGNDGLNTVVPITDGRYRDQRGPLAIDRSNTLSIDSETGLHPRLTSFKSRWNNGQLAIVEGIGYPNQDLSHFSSMAKWMSGQPTGVPDSGWLGRWLDGRLNGVPDLFAAAEIGHSVPLHVIGRRNRATAVPASRPSFGVGSEPRDLRAYETMRKMAGVGATAWSRTIGSAFVDHLEVADTVAGKIPENLAGSDVETGLDVAARLINANLGMRVLSVGWGDFDSHAVQPHQHDQRMLELNRGIQRFFSRLDGRWNRQVAIMTFSEFGRTSYGNDGSGTDHGSSAPHFVIGANVKGGRYGQRPSLAGLSRWDRMDHHVDVRDYYGSVIDGWLGGGSSTVLGRNTQNLGLFRRSPGR